MSEEASGQAVSGVDSMKEQVPAPAVAVDRELKVTYTNTAGRGAMTGSVA